MGNIAETYTSCLRNRETVHPRNRSESTLINIRVFFIHPFSNQI